MPVIMGVHRRATDYSSREMAENKAIRAVLGARKWRQAVKNCQRFALQPRENIEK